MSEIKVYGVKLDKGSWDDHVSWVAGLFDSAERAEEEKRRMVDHVKMMAAKYSKEENEKLDEELDKWFDDNKGMDLKDAPKHIRDYYHWCCDDEWRDFNTNSFCVQEFILNKPIDIIR